MSTESFIATIDIKERIQIPSQVFQITFKLSIACEIFPSIINEFFFFHAE